MPCRQQMQGGKKWAPFFHKWRSVWLGLFDLRVGLDTVLRIASLHQQLEGKDQELFRLQQHITDMQVMPMYEPN